MPNNDDLVLVTGGSGFLGGWCVRTLLSRGFRVRTTIRPLRSADELRKSLNLTPDRMGALEIVNADLGDNRGWSEAATGCRYALHVASPTALSFPGQPEELLSLARGGVLRVMEACLSANTERIVLTSTTFAMAYPKGGEGRPERTEADWTDPDDPRLSAYVRAKTLSEQDAWRFVASRNAEERLAVIAPGGIIGPLLGADVPDSMTMIQRLLQGRLPGLPKVKVEFVDVRDLAELNIKAMHNPTAGGKRLIASGDAIWLRDLAKLLKAELGQVAAKVNTTELPNWIVRLYSLRDPGARLIARDLGVPRAFVSDEAERKLAWKQRSLTESLRDCVFSMVDRGLI
jgi:dihydroflavonol-4-reductase